MGRTPWATYLWPGLPQLWKHGSWSALALAAGFAALVNLALIATLLWSEVLAPSTRTLVWMAAAILWAGSALYSRLSLRSEAVRSAEPIGDGYPDALDHYLKGNWFEAERTLAKLLRRNPRDLEARLLLATLLRHTGRIDEAVHELGRLQRFEGSQKWALEIGRERQWLAEARSAESRSEAVESGAEPPAAGQQAA